MRVLDSGHKYALSNLDGHIEDNSNEQILTFVKRNNPPEKYPGNIDSYPGTQDLQKFLNILDTYPYIAEYKPILSELVEKVLSEQ